MEPATQPNTAVPVQDTNQQIPTGVDNMNGKSKKWMWIILAVVLVVITAVGGYSYMGEQKQTAKEVAESSKALEQVKALEKEVNALDEGNLEAEFKVVDTDLQSL